MIKRATIRTLGSTAILVCSVAVASAGEMVKDGSGNPVMYKGMEKKAMMDDGMKKKDSMDKMEKKPMMDDGMKKKEMMDKKME